MVTLGRYDPYLSQYPMGRQQEDALNRMAFALARDRPPPPSVRERIAPVTIKRFTPPNTPT